MTYDFHSRFAFALQDTIVQGQALQWLADELTELPTYWHEIQVITDPLERLHVLAQAILGAHRDRARSGTRTKSGGYRLWVEQHAESFLRSRRKWMQDLQLEPLTPDLTLFPTNSWMLQIPFRLRKPYLSKDDRDFHLLDNPVRKEKVFQVPMVAATGWKGALRAALWHSGYQGEHDVTIRLLGDRRESELLRSGRLHFFATFFDKIGLEVINPHNRQTGVGERGSILMECVPQGATGTFVLLYVPFGPFDQREVAQDLAVAARGLQAMFTIYGFGAKTSSGFGVVEEQLAGPGKLLVRAVLSPTSMRPVRPTEPQIPASVQGFQARYPAEGFSLKPKEWREKSRATNREQEEYKNARTDFIRYQTALKSYQQQLADWEQAVADAPPPQPPVTECTFMTLSGLQEQACRVAAALQDGGEG